MQRNPPIVNVNGQIITTTPRYFDILFGEWLSWTRDYLPSSRIRGLRVLDVGAGCGETAFFFLSHGAEKVICVEPDKDNVEILRKNAAKNGWNIEVINAYFQLEMLDWNFDYMKMDCEGCEKELLKLDSLPSCSVEVHDPETHRRLVEKFDAKTVAYEGGNWIIQVPGHRLGQ